MRSWLQFQLHLEPEAGAILKAKRSSLREKMLSKLALRSQLFRVGLRPSRGETSAACP